MIDKSTKIGVVGGLALLVGAGWAYNWGKYGTPFHKEEQDIKQVSVPERIVQLDNQWEDLLRHGSTQPSTNPAYKSTTAPATQPSEPNNGDYRDLMREINGNPIRDAVASNNQNNNSQNMSQNIAEMRVSQRGLELIKQLEGFRNRPYKCPAGHKTIGYGHRILPGENYTSITREQAETLLRADVSSAENIIRQNTTIELSQNEFDALGSWTYNLGGTNYINSTMRTRLNGRDREGAANEMLRWNKITVKDNQNPGKYIKVPNDGLTNRRQMERREFLGEN